MDDNKPDVQASTLGSHALHWSAVGDAICATNIRKARAVARSTPYVSELLPIHRICTTTTLCQDARNMLRTKIQYIAMNIETRRPLRIEALKLPISTVFPPN
jgi:hypothetical protein